MTIASLKSYLSKGAFIKNISNMSSSSIPEYNVPEHEEEYDPSHFDDEQLPQIDITNSIISPTTTNNNQNNLSPAIIDSNAVNLNNNLSSINTITHNNNNNNNHSSSSSSSSNPTQHQLPDYPLSDLIYGLSLPHWTEQLISALTGNDPVNTLLTIGNNNNNYNNNTKTNKITPNTQHSKKRLRNNNNEYNDVNNNEEEEEEENEQQSSSNALPIYRYGTFGLAFYSSLLELNLTQEQQFSSMNIYDECFQNILKSEVTGACKVTGEMLAHRHCDSLWTMDVNELILTGKGIFKNPLIIQTEKCKIIAAEMKDKPTKKKKTRK